VDKTNLSIISGLIEDKLSDYVKSEQPLELTENLNELLFELKDELEAALKEFMPLAVEAEKINKSKPKLTDKTIMLELLAKLEPLLKDSDADCLNLLDEISAIPGAEHLADQIEEYDFKYALEALENLKKEL
jgi:ERCC4-related helicase